MATTYITYSTYTKNIMDIKVGDWIAYRGDGIGLTEIQQVVTATKLVEERDTANSLEVGDYAFELANGAWSGGDNNTVITLVNNTDAGDSSDS